jgi:hypothetical protein
MHIFTNEILMFYVIIDYIKSSDAFFMHYTSGLALDCFQIVGHFVIAKYVLLIYFAKQIYYKLYELQ